jgi:hypothetical protein
MRTSRVLGLAIAVSLVCAPRAEAVPTSGQPVNYCLSYLTFSACASAAITVSGSTLTAIVTNISNTNGNVLVGKLTGFGFFYLPGPGAGGTVALTGENHADTWVDGLGSLTNPLATSQGGVWLGGASGSTGNDYLAPGESATFIFSITGSPSWNDVSFAWRGQSLSGLGVAEAEFGSLKCYSDPAAGSEPVPSTCPETVVPEPASLTLLATGLFGLVAVGFTRRRKLSRSS